MEQKGGFVPSLLDTLDNTYIYEGRENPLTASRIYNTEFLCEYYLAYYPFDTQKCTMVFRMKGNFGTFVDLEPGIKSKTDFLFVYLFFIFPSNCLMPKKNVDCSTLLSLTCPWVVN